MLHWSNGDGQTYMLKVRVLGDRTQPVFFLSFAANDSRVITILTHGFMVVSRVRYYLHHRLSNLGVLELISDIVGFSTTEIKKTEVLLCF